MGPGVRDSWVGQGPESVLKKCIFLPITKKTLSLLSHPFTTLVVLIEAVCFDALVIYYFHAFHEEKECQKVRRLVGCTSKLRVENEKRQSFEGCVFLCVFGRGSTYFFKL